MKYPPQLWFWFGPSNVVNRSPEESLMYPNKSSILNLNINFTLIAKNWFKI